MNHKSWLILIWLAAIVVCIVLDASNLYWGDVNQDEGWYLYAAQQVADGRMPYRDFAFTQPPVMPLAYSILVPFIDQYGVAGGRCITALLGYFTAILGAFLVMRLCPRQIRWFAGCAAFALIACNVYQSYFTTIVKTYSLCAFFLVTGLWFLSYAGSRAKVPACFLSAMFLSLAAGTRISAGAVLPIAFLYLVWQSRVVGFGGFVAFALGGAATCVAIFLPFFLMSSDGFFFALFGYHTGRESGSLLSLLVYKAGFISRFSRAYLVSLILWWALLLYVWIQRPAGERVTPAGTPPHFAGLLWASFIGISLVHLSAPFPYEDYQVFVYPVLAIAVVGAHFARLCGPEEDAGSAAVQTRALWLALVVLGATTLSSFASEVNQDWFIKGRDRIWWHLKEQPALARLQEVGDWIAQHTEEGDLLLTQDTYLAVESGRDLPAGLEMGAFSYFPEWSRDKAESLNVLNREMMVELLESTDAPVAAFSGYGLAIQAPEVIPVPEEDHLMFWDTVLSRYEDVKMVPDFGQAHTTLRILRKKTETPAQP